MKPSHRYAAIAAAGLAAVLLALPTDSAPEMTAATTSGEVAKVDAETLAKRERRRRAKRQRRLDGLLKRTIGEQRTVTVSVTQCRAEPADGADVTLLVDGHPVAVGRTDRDGRFEARVPKLASVTALASGGPNEGGSQPTEGDALAVNICPGAEVVGRVLDGRGNPLADVTVTLGDGLDVAVTDADGTFVLTDLQLKAGEIRASGAGGQVAVTLAALEPAEQRQIDLTLEYGRRLTGWVVDASGAGVGYATVSAIDYGDREVLRVKSDRHGRFWLREVPFVDLTLVADTGDGAAGRLHVGADEVRDDLILRVEPSGTLVVAFSGPTSPQFEISEDTSRATDDAVVVTVVAAGQRVQLPAPKRYAVRFRDTDGESQLCGMAFLTPGKDAVVSCGTEGPGTVRGRVVDAAGAPLSGIPVWALSTRGRQPVETQTQTGADGRFSVGLTVASTVDVRLTVGTRRSEFLQSRRRNLQVGPGQVTDAGDIRLDRYEELADLFPRGPFGGLGAQIDETDDGIMLGRIVKGGPLDVAGLVAGDVIIGIDGDNTVGQLTANDAVRLLRGPDGSSVSIRIRRADGAVLDVNVDRQVIDVESSGWVN